MNQVQVEWIVARSVERFRAALSWKAQFIDDSDIEAYKQEIRRVIAEAVEEHGVPG